MSYISREECFKILEIERTNDIKVVKRAYAAMIRKYHPEDDPEKYEQIRRAYETLSKTMPKSRVIVVNPQKFNPQKAKTVQSSEPVEEEIEANPNKNILELQKDSNPNNKIIEIQKEKNSNKNKIETHKEKDSNKTVIESSKEKNQDKKIIEPKKNNNVLSFNEKKRTSDIKKKEDSLFFDEFDRMNEEKKEEVIDENQAEKEDYERFGALYKKLPKLGRGKYYRRMTNGILESPRRCIRYDVLEEIRSSDLYWEALKSKYFRKKLTDLFSKILLPEDVVNRLTEDIDLIKGGNAEDYKELLTIIRRGGFSNRSIFFTTQGKMSKGYEWPEGVPKDKADRLVEHVEKLSACMIFVCFTTTFSMAAIFDSDWRIMLVPISIVFVSALIIWINKKKVTLYLLERFKDNNIK